MNSNQRIGIAISFIDRVDISNDLLDRGSPDPKQENFGGVGRYELRNCNNQFTSCLTRVPVNPSRHMLLCFTSLTPPIWARIL